VGGRPFLKLKTTRGLVGHRGGHPVSRHIDADMRGCLSFFHFDDRSLQHIPGAEFHSLSILPALPCSFEQDIKLRIGHIDLIEYLVEVARVTANVAWKLVRKEQTGKPLKPQNPVHRGRSIDPAVWQAWTQENAAPFYGFDVRPCRPG